MAEANTGGRVQLALQSEVRILQLDGTISTEKYVVDQERSDRNGLMSLKESGTNRAIKVHHRRILPPDVDGRAVVIESNNKYWAVHGSCGRLINIAAPVDSIECPDCSVSFPLYWLGEKPMSAESAVATPDQEVVATAKPKKEKPPKAAKAPKPPKPPKEPRVAKEAVKIDFGAVSSVPNCELWTKSNVRFDHERIDVKAHVLIFTGEGQRKMCFNTYNSTLGQKGGNLPMDEFLADSTPATGKKSWFPVSDVEKLRAQLSKTGYTKYGS